MNLPENTKKKFVKILYRNYRGEVSMRKILPGQLFFGKTEWHNEEQYLLRAFDLEKNTEHDFAMKDIIVWFVPDINLL